MPSRGCTHREEQSRNLHRKEEWQAIVSIPTKKTATRLNYARADSTEPGLLSFSEDDFVCGPRLCRADVFRLRS